MIILFFFTKLARDIFGINDIVFDSRFDERTSLQLTGGFSSNPPLMLLLNDSPVLTEEEKESIMLQSTESQNHFCYMWSIWSLHLRMIGQDPYNIAQFIYGYRIDPLTVIKRYIWSLFNYKDLKLIDQIQIKYRAFFEYHWPAIWSNDPLRFLVKNTVFRRYTVPLDTCQDLNECINLSYQQLKVISEQNLTPLTEKSEELIECSRRKK